jgi:uncharacterized GH25 family protein
MERHLIRAATAALLILFAAGTAAAHDTWVEANTNLVRPGDYVLVSLMLGNHGNDHRDFKLAGKADLTKSTLVVLAPNGKRHDLKERLADNGLKENEGYWNARFTGNQPGLYLAAHTFDKVLGYAPVRAVKSAKTFFVVSPSLDRVPRKNPGFDQILGHPLELVPITNPVTPMAPGTPIAVRLLYKGKPLPDTRVSFIPRGQTLAKNFDKTFEHTTDGRGEARFTVDAGNCYLVVAHRIELKEGGKNYRTTKYSATLTVYVPQRGPAWED